MENVKFLKLNTSEFFELHLPKVKVMPNWSDPWYFADSIPQQEMQGCYALLNKNNEILYIGVGAGRGSEKYKGAGLGSRLHKYWRMNKLNPKTNDGKKNYEPEAKWRDKGVCSIVTIGFKEYSYLAYALEAYLIGKIETPYNVIGKKAI